MKRLNVVSTIVLFVFHLNSAIAQNENSDAPSNSPQKVEDGTAVIGIYNAGELAGSRSLSKQELEDWISEANGGLEQKVIGRISKEIGFCSVGDFVAWSLDSNRSMLDLSSKELAYANEQLLRRRDDREKSLSVCRAMLVGKEGLKESDIGSALRLLLSNELKSERRLYESLEEVLYPKRKEQLCRLIVKHGLQSTNVPMVVDYLKLTSKQVALFRAAVESIMKSLDKQPPEIGKEATKKILAAENSLNLEQFTFYAQCVGKLKEGKTLKEQLDQLDKRQRQELCEAYSLFREASQQ